MVVSSLDFLCLFGEISSLGTTLFTGIDFSVKQRFQVVSDTPVLPPFVCLAIVCWCCNCDLVV